MKLDKLLQAETAQKHVQEWDTEAKKDPPTLT